MPRRRPAGIRHSTADQVLVIGLGRFGASLATSLMGLGYEVLGVDTSPALVQRYSGLLTQTVEADSTDADVLRQLGAGEFPIAVVGIGTGIEASVLTVAALGDLGVPDIWAKAITEPHARILERVGVHHVVFPEAEMGERVAHLVTGRMMEYLELDPGFALVETTAPTEMLGKSLTELMFRSRYGVTVVCIKPAGGVFTYATPDTVVGEGDTILVAGETARAEAFANLT
ncbi:potassium channel family protein [Rhabdothermincola salaria]|uniref:potassium channel family protein n=1 Tax=Rhabdothermincola salaria TaxID=2903142 RepID=UPI001E29104D|nr:TrkA family potassium uptake protein [Rhabdothermincola salaria]MCD9622469.1 TrkA family potassium uptake protein [Rhabdothermincola salaria]